MYSFPSQSPLKQISELQANERRGRESNSRDQRHLALVAVSNAEGSYASLKLGEKIAVRPPHIPLYNFTWYQLDSDLYEP